MLVALSILLIIGLIQLSSAWQLIRARPLSKTVLAASPAVYLERMVERKKAEVESLLRRHEALDDPLFLRMNYLASEGRYNITNSIKKPATTPDGALKMSVIIDMKRTSPTVPERRNIVDFENAGKFAELLTKVGADAILVNTDEVEYGGRLEELKEASKAIRQASKQAVPPACIRKDLIIHPIQIAQSLHNGAAGVLLVAAAVGADLEVLLDSCTIMGTEAIVEVHTPNELEFALSRGATIFLVNMWDRMSGKLFVDQAKGLATMLPMNAVAVAAGNIHSVEEVAELGYYGFDGVVLGRNLAEVPDIKQFIDKVHALQGPARGATTGLKGSFIGTSKGIIT